MGNNMLPSSKVDAMSTGHEKLHQAVSRIANLAAEIDVLKFEIPDGVMRDRLLSAVVHIHEVASFYDHLHGFGEYAQDDLSTKEAA